MGGCAALDLDAPYVEDLAVGAALDAADVKAAPVALVGDVLGVPARVTLGLHGPRHRRGLDLGVVAHGLHGRFVGRRPGSDERGAEVEHGSGAHDAELLELAELALASLAGFLDAPVGLVARQPRGVVAAVDALVELRPLRLQDLELSVHGFTEVARAQLGLAVALGALVAHDTLLDLHAHEVRRRADLLRAGRPPGRSVRSRRG